MRLSVRDIKATATADDGRVILRLGSLRYTCSRTEAVQLATEIVTAVDCLSLKQESDACRVDSTQQTDNTA